jgi:predicted membrane chloride channel (bestrophin family)/CRP-like cAMP-binding protein
MIVYDTKKYNGLVVLLRALVRCDWEGSVLLNVLPYAAAASLVAGTIKLDGHFRWNLFTAVHDDTLFDHSYSLQVWATSVGFLLVFRGNLAYQRFWEARSAVAQFSSYLQDATMSAICFDEVHKEMNQYREWKKELLHQSSLLHTLALQTLRLDDNLNNLGEFFSCIPSDDAALALDVMKTNVAQRTEMQRLCLEEWLGTIEFFQKRETHRAQLAKELIPVYFNDGEIVFAQGDEGDALYLIVFGEVDVVVDGVSAGCMVPGQCFGDRALEMHGRVDKRTATIVAVGSLTVARLGADAYYECVGKREQQSSNSASLAARPVRRHASVDTARLLDRSASYRSFADIQESAKEAAEHPLGVIAGLRKAERVALERCETFNGARVLVAQSWLTQCIVRRRTAGGLAVDPPVLATGVYRNLQQSNEAFNQCKKIVDTPFPYPYAQAVMLSIVLYTFIAPIVICQIVNSAAWAISISFIAVGSFVTLNEVARALEEPFGHSSNQLPMDDLSAEYNEKLWCLALQVHRKDAWPTQQGVAAYPLSPMDLHGPAWRCHESQVAACEPTKGEPPVLGDEHSFTLRRGGRLTSVDYGEDDDKEAEDSRDSRRSVEFLSDVL